MGARKMPANGTGGTMRVIYGKDRPCQLAIPWGTHWYDAAREWAQRHGWRIDAQTPGQRILVNGQWMRVEWSDAAGEFQISAEIP